MIGTKMTSHSNQDDKEGDLHDIDDPQISYEETNTDDINEKIRKSRGKRVSGICTLPSSSHSLYKRTISDKLADVFEQIIGFFKKSIDFLRVFVYNLYCKHKHHERIKTVKTKDNTKSTENTKSNTRKWYKPNWGAIGRGIMGLGLFLLVASEILSTAIIIMGTGDDIVPKVLVAPIAIHAFIVLIKVFVTFTRKGEK